MACPPKVGYRRRCRAAYGRHVLVRRFAPKTSNGAFRAAALLREGSISVRFLCVMLFNRYLKFFLEMGTRMVRRPEPIRAPDRHRWDGSVGMLHEAVTFAAIATLAELRSGGELCRCVTPPQLVPTKTTRRKTAMKTRAAVAVGEGQAARDHGGRSRRPEGRRGAGRDQGHRHLPHRRVHALRRRPRRAVPGHPRPRGRRHRRRCRAGRDQREEGRPRHPALHARMPAVPVLPLAQDQPVHGHPRHPGPGRDAGRHLALLARRQEAASTTWAPPRSRTSPCCPRSRSPRSARTRPSTRSATSAAASPPASAPSSTPPRWSPAPRPSCSGSAASASTSSRACGSPAPT